MAARIKTMNHFSPKLRPPDIISKYQSEISEVIHSLIRSPQCYQMPPHQTGWWRVERYFISSSVDIFRSGDGRWVVGGGWVGRWLQGPGMETIKRKNSHILGMATHSHLISTIRWLLFECMLNEQNILFVLGHKKVQFTFSSKNVSCYR